LVLRAEIVHAIESNQALDYSHLVLGGKERDHLRPPVVKSAAEEYPPEPTAEDYLSIEDFERLSLAARGALYWQLSDVTAWQRQPGYTEAPKWATNAYEMKEIKAAELMGAIETAAENARRRLGRATHGLQIIGARIEGDIDLTNARLPFSIRLIGCAINGAIRMRRADLVTLDISGCAVKGVCGTFMRARGSVRMRRLMCSSVVDMGGLRVADVFDASDVLVVPLDDVPRKDSFAGDRGIFNLSLAVINSEMRFTRARIYGGLTLKGARIKRSMFLENAILRAPTAFLEHVGFDLFQAVGRHNSHERAPSDGHDAVYEEMDERVLPLVVRASARAEIKIAYELHRGGEPEDRWLRDYETIELLSVPTRLRTGDDKERCRLLRRLLAESIRARNSSIRADGMTIKGSIFARSVRAGGGIRLRYATIGGTLHLEGARLRSAREVDAALDCIQEKLKDLHDPCDDNGKRAVDFIEETRGTTERHARSMEPRGVVVDYALDMRDSRVAGDIRLSSHRRSKDSTGDKSHETEIQKAIDDLKAGWMYDPINDASAKENPNSFPYAAMVLGCIALEQSKLDGQLDLRSLVANAHNLAPHPDAPFLNFDQAEIAGDVDLRSTIGVVGVRGGHAKIGGKLRFGREGERKSQNVLKDENAKETEEDSGDAGEGPEGCMAGRRIHERAIRLGGKIELGGAHIQGDALLLFLPREGPELILPRLNVESRLRIVPLRPGKQTEDGRFTPQRVPEGVTECAYGIDLRSARASEFGHSEGAWPLPDKLVIEGFSYEHTCEYGPLHPREKTGDYEEQNEKFWKRSGEMGIAALAMLATVFVIIPRLGLFNFGHWIDVHLGVWNVALLACVAAVFWFDNKVKRESPPKIASTKPRALEWLELQRGSANIYRTKGESKPLQPYLQAVRVLRAGGHILAAHRVEYERLRHRFKQLSWRTQWAPKSVLMIADLTAEYGFVPLRTLQVGLAVAAIAACIFHSADRAGHMRPIAGDLLQVVGGEPRLFSPENLQQSDGGGAQGLAARVATLYPSFVSLGYALDVMVPGLDLGQEEYWRPSGFRSPAVRHDRLAVAHEREHPLDDALGEPEPASPQSLFWILYTITAPILKIIGWLLATALAISVISRVEAMMARREE